MVREFQPSKIFTRNKVDNRTLIYFEYFDKYRGRVPKEKNIYLQKYNKINNKKTKKQWKMV